MIPRLAEVLVRGCETNCGVEVDCRHTEPAPHRVAGGCPPFSAVGTPLVQTCGRDRPQRRTFHDKHLAEPRRFTVAASRILCVQFVPIWLGFVNGSPPPTLRNQPSHHPVSTFRVRRWYSHARSVPHWPRSCTAGAPGNCVGPRQQQAAPTPSPLSPFPSSCRLARFLAAGRTA